MSLSSTCIPRCTFNKTTFAGTISCGSHSIHFDSTQAPIKEVGVTSAVNTLGLQIFKKDVLLFEEGTFQPLDISRYHQVALFQENNDWIRIQLDEESIWADISGTRQRSSCCAYRQITDLTMSKAIKRSQNAWNQYVKENFPRTSSYFLYNANIAIGLVAKPFKIFHINKKSIIDCNSDPDATHVNSIPLTINDAVRALELENSVVHGTKKKDRFSTLLFDRTPLRLILSHHPMRGSAHKEREVWNELIYDKRNEMFMVKLPHIESRVDVDKQFDCEGVIKHHFYDRDFQVILKKTETEFPYDLKLFMRCISDSHKGHQSFNFDINGYDKLIKYSKRFCLGEFVLRSSINLSFDSALPKILSIAETDDEKSFDYSLVIMDNIPPIMFEKKITVLADIIQQKLMELFHSLKIKSHKCESCCCDLLNEENPVMSKEEIMSIQAMFDDWLATHP